MTTGTFGSAERVVAAARAIFNSRLSSAVFPGITSRAPAKRPRCSAVTIRGWRIYCARDVDGTVAAS